MDNLDSQVVLVTGSGRGIGRAMAERLAAAGAAVAVAARSENEVRETANRIQAQGGRALAVPFDVTDTAQVGNAITLVETRLGPVDVLVNNAGAFGPIGPLWEINSDDWWQTLTVNVYGTLLCTRHVLPGMIERRQGRIITLASSVATRARPYATAYSTSKAALVHLMECLAIETKDRGVAVFAIHPGTVLTDMTRMIIDTEPGQKWLPTTRSTFAEGRDVPPERAAELVVRLASGQADRLSGRFISVFDDLTELLRQTNSS
ncbi:MAG: SDR family oxidoreductase [Chloroflexi bacterium]|nr:SDR family oxidoreductase [Chloroflexota bacterium]